MTSYGIRTEYDENAGRKRDHLTVWSGPFYSVHEADGASLPKRNGYMLRTYNGDKVRVACPAPRTDDNWREVDAAISAALTAYETARRTVTLAHEWIVTDGEDGAQLAGPFATEEEAQADAEARQAQGSTEAQTAYLA